MIFLTESKFLLCTPESFGVIQRSNDLFAYSGDQLWQLFAVFENTGGASQTAHQSECVYHAYWFYSGLDSHFHVGQTENVLIEHIFNTFFFQIELGHEFVTAAQRSFERHGEPRHYRVHSFFVQACETDPHRCEKLMARMFQIMLIVGIVHNTLQVAFIIAYLHLQFINILFHKAKV